MRRLTEHQIAEFFARGFVVVPDVFRADEIAKMVDAFKRLEATAQYLSEPALVNGSQFVVERVATPGGSRVRINRIVWCGAAEPVLATFGGDPRLVGMAAQLLGSAEMSQLINQAHFKLPGDGVSFPWHQDSTHRRYGGDLWKDVNGRGSYVQTVTALDDVTHENGPIELIPGSCTLGHLGLAPDAPLPPAIDPATACAPMMSAGSVLLFGPFTVHRSLPNASRTPRRVFINGYASPGANSRVYPGVGAGRMLRATEVA